MRQQAEPRDDLRHRLIRAEHADHAARFLCDPFLKMLAVILGTLLADPVVDAGGVLLVQPLDDEIEIRRRETRGAICDLKVGGAGPGAGSEWKKKDEEEESPHRRQTC